jgi:hypothetical protein
LICVKAQKPQECFDLQQRSRRNKEVEMTLNIGTADRVLRIIIGLALVAFAWWSTAPYAWLGYIGVVPLLTAAFGTCPAYSLLGINTCPARKA